MGLGDHATAPAPVVPRRSPATTPCRHTLPLGVSPLVGKLGIQTVASSSSPGRHGKVLTVVSSADAAPVKKLAGSSLQPLGAPSESRDSMRHQ